MLDCDSKQAVYLELEPVTVGILGSHAHLFRTLDLLAGGGKAQAALLEQDGPVCQGSPSCVAASPTPGAAYMVSAMSSMSWRSSGVSLSTFLPGSRRRASG
jgi:hypothetical protein